MPSGPDRKKEVLFVCTGNVCRSPMAEYLFKNRMGPDSGWTASSAGISAALNAPASEPAVEVMRELGIEISRHRSRPLTREAVDHANMIVVMTDLHRVLVAERFPHAKDRLFALRDFDTRGRGDIQDPIGLSTDGYRRIRDEIDEALLDLIIYLRKHNASPAASNIVHRGAGDLDTGKTHNHENSDRF